MFSVHHIALSVSDVDRSEDFYCRYFEFERAHNWEAEDGSLTIRQLVLGGVQLELFCFANPDPLPSHSKSLDTDLKTLGTKHIGIRVHSVHECASHLRSKGYEGDIQIKQGRTGITYFFISDPDGILVEVAEDKRNLGQSGDK